MTRGILNGVRVLDCSIARAGPFAAQRLGDLGADVVEIEPVSGEWQRHVAAGGARGVIVNVSFLSLNRNKRSLAVNLKSPEGKAVLFDLVKSADMFLQNYRPGVAPRMPRRFIPTPRVTTGSCSTINRSSGVVRLTTWPVP